MAIDGNITTITIDEADLEARFPQLDQYLATGQADWSGMIAAAVEEALEVFRRITGDDPEDVKTASDGQWRLVLIYTALKLVFEAQPGEAFRDREEHYALKASEMMNACVFLTDHDGDGEIDTENPAEAQQRANELVVLR